MAAVASSTRAKMDQARRRRLPSRTSRPLLAVADTESATAQPTHPTAPCPPHSKLRTARPRHRSAIFWERAGGTKQAIRLAGDRRARGSREGRGAAERGLVKKPAHARKGCEGQPKPPSTPESTREPPESSRPRRKGGRQNARRVHHTAKAEHDVWTRGMDEDVERSHEKRADGDLPAAGATEPAAVGRARRDRPSGSRRREGGKEKFGGGFMPVTVHDRVFMRR